MWQTMQPALPMGAVTPPGLVINGMDEKFVRGWMNDTYIAWQYEFGSWGHLSIKRRDREPIHDWRHLQQIKDDIYGPDREAVELYPSRSRVLDAANQYHLWVLPKGKVMALGVQHRTVMKDPQTAKDMTGASQRPFEEGLTI